MIAGVVVDVSIGPWIRLVRQSKEKDPFMISLQRFLVDNLRDLVRPTVAVRDPHLNPGFGVVSVHAQRVAWFNVAAPTPRQGRSFPYSTPKPRGPDDQSRHQNRSDDVDCRMKCSHL